MWDGEYQQYYWVVLCKNHHYHLKQSQAAGHQILLGETDGVSPPPHLELDFKVRCDDCGKDYSYSPRELLRYETKPPASFLAHPQTSVSAPASVMSFTTFSLLIC